jgi:hypothetical protein
MHNRVWILQTEKEGEKEKSRREVKRREGEKCS